MSSAVPRLAFLPLPFGHPGLVHWSAARGPGSSRRQAKGQRLKRFPAAVSLRGTARWLHKHLHCPPALPRSSVRSDGYCECYCGGRQPAATISTMIVSADRGLDGMAGAFEYVLRFDQHNGGPRTSRTHRNTSDGYIQIKEQHEHIHIHKTYSSSAALQRSLYADCLILILNDSK